MNVSCDGCGRRNGNAVLAYRLDPRTWRPKHRCLCEPCRRRLGFTVERFARGEAMAL